MINVRVPKNMEGILKEKKNIKIDVRIGDFLNDVFFKSFTKFQSYGEFIYFSPYTDDELVKDVKLFYTYDMNRYIYLTTNFDSFEELLAFAVEKNFELNGGKYE